MYLDFYALNTKPFKLSPDPSFIWMGERYREALAVLQYGLIDKKGFLLITGDVGTGKTTLINTLLNRITGNTVVANVPNPDLETLDFLNFIAFAFGLQRRFKHKAAFLSAFSKFLNSCFSKDKNVVLIVDEAHRLNHTQLEQIRLLSNIERQDAKLINIFFVGQNEFLDHITETRNRALRQRITINYHIDPLDQNEVGDYLRHRLKIAGAQRPIFSEQAVESLYYHSRGYPRVINNIGDLALLTGFVKSSEMIDAQIITECAQDLCITPQPTIEVISPAQSADDLEHDLVTYTEIKPKRRGLLPVGLASVACILLAGVLYVSSPIKDFFTPDEPTVASVLTKQTAPRPSALPPDQALRNRSGDTSHTQNQKSTGIQDRNQLSKPKVAIEKASLDRHDLAISDLSATPQAAVVTKKIDSAVEIKPLSILSVREVHKALPKKVLVPFDHDSAALTAAQNDVLENVVGYLGDHPWVRVTIKGYTDNRGNPWYNIRLSRLRADMVKHYLVTRGVASSRITTFALGVAEPIASNDSPEGREQNRRVELSFTPIPKSLE